MEDISCGFNKTIPHFTQPEKQLLLAEKFSKRCISRQSEVNKRSHLKIQSPRHIYFKLKACANKRKSSAELKDYIRRFFGHIKSTKGKYIIENFIKRTRFCSLSKGGHWTIIFHKFPHPIPCFFLEFRKIFYRKFKNIPHYT